MTKSDKSESILKLYLYERQNGNFSTHSNYKALETYINEVANSDNDIDDFTIIKGVELKLTSRENKKTFTVHKEGY